MLKTQLNKITPYNDQEKTDIELFTQFLTRNEDAFLRSNLTAHVTSSAIIVNQQMDKILFAHHNIYGSWGWVGGHNDGEKDTLHVAIKEAKEETGLTHVEPVSEDIFMVDVIFVPNHYKHNKRIPDHLHLNVTYLLKANDRHPVYIKPDENSGVRWFSFNELLDFVNEPRMIPIYQKALEKINSIKHPKKSPQA